MKSLFMLAVLLPQLVVSDSTGDTEKYQSPIQSSSSLYCNDLNPQSHLDFNMVKMEWVTIYEIIAQLCVVIFVNTVLNEMILREALNQR